MDSPPLSLLDMEKGSYSGGVNIGCGTDVAPGNFFTGLIDEVRFYNRAVKP
jgi:hypothetical protein